MHVLLFQMMYLISLIDVLFVDHP